MQIVECVPNVSEGRNQQVLDELAKVVRAVAGVTLLDVDPGAETNRTVFTFVGEKAPIAEAAFRFIEKAQSLIDMRGHRGEHARMGATDVCPFVPVSGVTMEECVELAKEVGARVGKELSIPVYLYEAAASSPQRRNLADIRKGEYEQLGTKLVDPTWKPDYGPAAFGDSQKKSGATVIGARPFLIAYNINLNTRDKKLANDVAFALRESGRAKRDDKGDFVFDAQGQKVMVPGRLKSVKATGWVIESYGCAQISMNLTDLAQTSLHAAFDACVEEATKRGLRVTGSELVGLVPRDSVLAAGRHYLQKMNKPDGVPERELVHTAVRTLGLSEVAAFDADKKIIEYAIAAPARLAKMTIGDFVDELSSESPAPGGGSASALCGALSTALTSMVATLTAQKKEHEKDRAQLLALGRTAQELKAALVVAIDRDTTAFDQVLAAMRLPKTTAEEQAKRAAAIEVATQGATLVPLQVMRDAHRALEMALVAVDKGFAPSLSDAAVAAHTAFACLSGAYLNVRINLRDCKDDKFVNPTRQQADMLHSQGEQLLKDATAAVSRRL